jgi:glycerol uptake facilitator protein
MSPFFAEFIGMAILIILGNGVNANVSLTKTYGNSSGWIVIAFGWAIAVFVAVYITAPYSGAHLNPAVSIGLAYAGKFSWALVPGYITAQFAGAICGAIINWLAYKKHFDATEDANAKLGVFCNAPAIAHTGYNLLTEIIGTFVLIFGVLFMVAPASSLGALDALPVALLVLGIGLSIGGATGYAINPARDLGPRMAHFLLPISGKRNSNWAYSWIPVVGPIIGALLAAIIFNWVM